ncbi:MAG: ketoacyl-ACP synthase III [Clostridia bacterium]|nr:ketoacyl-ACP synthase III [Clostridia bacterium]
MSIKITGTGSALPELSKTNEDLSKILDTSHEWIFSRTGIASRHICEEGLTPIAVQAGINALKDAAISAETLDYIICATVSSDYGTPSLACLVQKELGATCPAMDLSAACAGFIYGLEVADAFISSGKAKRILLIAAESMSSTVDWTKRDVSVLFGDGAGAAIIEKGDDLMSICTNAFGRPEPLYMKRPKSNCPFVKEREGDVYLHMDGQEIYKFAVNAMIKDITHVLEEANVDSCDVDYVLPHQANMRIIDAATRKLSIPKEKFLSNIESTGNTSAASIPILLDESCKSGLIKAGQLLVMTAFGAGLTTGACVIKWSKS